VGDRKITAEEFERITAALPPQFAGAMAQLGKRGFADQYASLLALAQEGEKLQVDERESFRQMVEFQRIIILAQSTVNELAGPQTPVSDADIQAQYTAHQSELEEVHLRGIYVPFDPEPGETGAQPPPGPVNPGAERVTEAAARAKAEGLRNRVTAGEDLAELAKTESEHPTSSSGGDFGFVRREQFAPEIDSAIFALQPNETTQPLRDRFGFFIFRLEEKRTVPLEQVRQAIENSVRQQKLVELFARMKAAYPVILDSRYFPETPAPPPGFPPAPQQ
jgi:parvulin-like peptidyl-prolyl isomerase